MSRDSRTIRLLQFKARSSRPRSLPTSYSEGAEDVYLIRDLDAQEGWDIEAGIPTLVQTLQAEREPVRNQLVRMLGRIKGSKATAALARMAVFDLSGEIRRTAIEALDKRSLKDARPVFLAALRYPWAPAAEHAAEALVALDDQDAVPGLKKLLDEPNPSEPFRNKEGKWMVNEVVRVNHLRNCLMCHAPSLDRKDMVRGLVPTPGRPLPVAVYYEGAGTFVRADVTYLKQDFSVMQPVKDAKPWPEVQRFDYLVRTRELKAVELANRVKPVPVRKIPEMWQEPFSSSTYPQKEAIRFALRELAAAADLKPATAN